MKIECHKTPHGFVPVDQHFDKFKKIENGSVIALTYRLPRNYQFHKKVFAFFNYCFQYWRGDREFLDESTQFDHFRKNLIIIAGYYEEYYNIQGDVYLAAKSISYAKMNQDEIESFYHALVNSAMSTIFKGCGEEHYDELIGFF